MLKIVVCKNCQKEIKVDNWRKVQFCSKSCATSHNRRKIHPVEQRTCLNCKTTFEFHINNSDGSIGKFCSQKCHLEHMKSNKLYQKLTCPVCSKEYEQTARTLHKKYCSSACANQDRASLIKVSLSKIDTPLDWVSSKSLEILKDEIESLLLRREEPRIPQEGTFFQEDKELYCNILTYPFIESSLSFRDRIFLILSGLSERPNCVVCGEKVTYSLSGGKWGTTCSNVCKNKFAMEYLSPRFNKDACTFFLSLDKKINSNPGIDSRYAMYGNGELSIDNTFYLDYINHKKKIIIEWQERNHKYTQKRDGYKKKRVMEHFPDYNYIVLWEKDSLTVENFISKFIGA